MMINIAVFVSGDGELAEQLVRTFNTGNRIHVALCLTDHDNNPVMEKLAEADVPSEFYPDEVWRNEPATILDTLRSHDISLIVLDGFTGLLRSEILDAYNDRIFREDETPMSEQIMKYMKKVEHSSDESAEISEVEESSAPNEDSPKEEASPEKSVDDAWAETLGVKNNVQHSDDDPQDDTMRSSSDSNVKPWMQNRAYGDPDINRPDPNYGNNFGSNNTGGSYNQGYNHAGARVSGVSGVQSDSEPMPSTWLVWSVLATVLCCTLPGIVAIIQSARVSSKYYAGDIEGAKRASRNAEIWIIISFVLGVISNTLYLPLTIAGLL